MNIKFLFIVAILFFSLFSFAQSVYIGDSGKASLNQFDLDGNFIALIDDDVNTPRGITSDDNLLFYVNKDDGQLIRYDLNLNLKTVIASQLDNPFDVTAINRKDFLIITELDGEISRIDYDGSNYRKLTTGIEKPLFLTHDPVLEKVFFTNRASIYSMNYDGTDIEIIPGSYDDVVAIEVDPRNETVYFSERGSTNKISKMNYDGSEREIILDSPLLFSFLDLNCEQNKLYFTAGSDNLYGAFDLDGKNFEIYDIESTVIGGLDLAINDCDVLSSIKEYSNSKVKVFPNPTEGLINIDYDSDIDKIEVLDFQGRIIQTSFPSSQVTSIELDLKKGCYLLRIYSKTEISYKTVIKF